MGHILIDTRRDRLGVVTRALFAQRDFTDLSILEDFQSSLELGLRSQLTESGLYMGTIHSSVLWIIAHLSTQERACMLHCAV